MCEWERFPTTLPVELDIEKVENQFLICYNPKLYLVAFMKPFLLTLTFTALSASFAIAEDVNLLPQGAFAAPETIVVAPAISTGTWQLSPGDFANHGISYSLKDENGMKYVQVKTTLADGVSAWLSTEVNLPDPKPAEVKISGKVRVPDLKLGTVGGPEWLSAQVQMEQASIEEGEAKSEGNSIIYRTKGAVTEWTTFEQVISLKAASSKLKIQIGLWGQIGTMEVTDLKVVAVAPVTPAAP